MIRKFQYLIALAVSFVAASAFLLSCEEQPGLKTGDLVFVGIPADYGEGSGSMSEAISDATGSGDLNMIHVAIVEVEKDSIWIIDATMKHGVDRYPLDTFLCDFTLRDGSYPEFVVMRLKDNRRAKEYVATAMTHVGKSYNSSFVHCDTAKYCSELVHDCYLGKDGKSIFSESPMNFLDADGNLPAYWEKLFARMGVPVPQDVPGTNPQAMMAEPVLENRGNLLLLRTFSRKNNGH